MQRQQVLKAVDVVNDYSGGYLGGNNTDKVYLPELSQSHNNKKAMLAIKVLQGSNSSSTSMFGMLKESGKRPKPKYSKFID